MSRELKDIKKSKNFGKKMVFSGENSIQNIVDNYNYNSFISVYSEDNPLFNERYSKEDLDKIKNVLKQNISSQMDVREGAVPLMVCYMMSHGYSLSDIVNNNVPDNEYESFKTTVMGLENAETQKQSKEELGKAYVGSMHKMINLIDDKTKAKSKDPGYIYSKENMFLKSMYAIASMNYLQDDSALNDAVKNYEGDYKYNNAPFSLEEETKKLSSKMDLFSVNSVSGKLIETLAKENEMTDPKQLMEQYVCMQYAQNYDFEDLNELVSASTQFEGYVPQDFSSWLEDKNEKTEHVEFLKQQIGKSALFNDVEYVRSDTIDDEQRIVVKSQTSFSKFKEEYEDFKVMRNIKKSMSEDKQNVQFDENDVKQKNEYDVARAYSYYALDDMCDEMSSRFTKSVKNNTKDEYTEKDYDDILKVSETWNKFKSKKGFNGYGEVYSALSDYHPEKMGEDKEGKKCSIEQKRKIEQIFEDLKFDFKQGLSEFKECPYDEDVMKKAKDVYGKEANGQNVQKAIETSEKLKDEPSVKKVKNNPDISKTQNSIISVYKKLYDDLAKTSKVDKEGKLTGNSTLFDNMLKSVKNVVDFNTDKSFRNSNQFYEKMCVASGQIKDYLKERDKRVIFTEKGRQRVDILKKFNNLTSDMINDYKEFSSDVKSMHEKNNSILNENDRSLDPAFKNESRKEKNLERPVKQHGKNKEQEKQKDSKDKEKQEKRKDDRILS